MGGFFSSSSWQATETRQSTIPKCGACGLHHKCLSPRMAPSGDGKHKILFVGESPGLAEDRQGVPFIGKSGQKLREVLDSLDVDLDDCWSTYALTCHPPEDKMEPKYVRCCRAVLVKTIQELKPHVIVLLGEEALDGMLEPLWGKDMGSFRRWIGWTIPLAEHDAWVCPTYHPQTLLQTEDPVLELMFRDHLRKAVRLERKERNFTTTKQLQAQVEVITQERMIRARLRDLLKREGRMAFDYETTGLKPEPKEQEIVSCSFCLEGRDTFAFPTKSDKVKTVLSKVLRREELAKIASNLKFEERWTLVKMGHGVANWYWDTMLAAHVHDNRSKITSVKFQAFVLLGVPDYSSHILPYLKSVDGTANGLNRIHDIDLKDMLVYNGMDSLLEFMVMEEQMKALGWKP